MYNKPRLPDPVRTAGVRAVVIVALTLVLVMVAVLCSLAEVWLAFPMVLASVGGTVVATWGVLDVWVTRQVWVQRNGVVSEPSSVARDRAWAQGRPPEQRSGAASEASARGRRRHREEIVEPIHLPGREPEQRTPLRT
ncbi:hypothetical protein [Streptomyces sulphureus]|uniref:hypothetical protein n=1 Tax=Streptomyces sulphureus TaxID=47758 RepID=UPI000362096B|nr:hypothetical protein [Streptomyces sulphureus]